MSWRKSSWSGFNGNCVEVWRKSPYSDLDGHCLEVAFRKSSYSLHNGGCTEAALQGGIVKIRDSKQAPRPGCEGPTGPELPITPADWNRFITDIKTGAITC